MLLSQKMVNCSYLVASELLPRVHLCTNEGKIEQEIGAVPGYTNILHTGVITSSGLGTILQEELEKCLGKAHLEYLAEPAVTITQLQMILCAFSTCTFRIWVEKPKKKKKWIKTMKYHTPFYAWLRWKCWRINKNIIQPSAIWTQWIKHNEH